MDTPLLLLVALLFLLLPLLVVLLAQHGARKGKNSGRLPPGPPAVPLLGNWQRHSVQHLVARYGSVVSLRVGTRLVVLVADRRVAHAALVETGATLADRPAAAARAFLGGETGNTTVSRATYGPVWRLLRRNLVAGTLHPSRFPLFAPARAWARRALAGRLRALTAAAAAAPCVAEEFWHAVSCLLVLMCFGEPAARAVAAAQRSWLLFMAYRAHVFAFWPAVTKLLFRRRLQMGLAAQRRLSDVFLPLIDARRERKQQLSHGGGAAAAKKNATTFEHCYVDTLLDIKLPDEEGGRALTDDALVSLCSEFLAAGTDTTSTALQWIMAELVKNPAIQRKLHGEITAACGAEQEEVGVGEEDTRRMPYLRAVVLEGLRRHPPAHALLAHRAAEDVEVCGHLIPRGAWVQFAVAEMGWDGRVWRDPMRFSPERFMPGGDGEGVDVTGARGIRMMPFGAGRRARAGLGVAVLHLEYFVANLVREFEWPEVAGDEVDLAERHETTAVMKKPLRARLVPRRIQGAACYDGAVED